MTTDEAAAVDATATPPSKRRKRRLIGFLGGLGVLAVLVLALVIAGAWARRGFFVAFNDDDTS